MWLFLGFLAAIKLSCLARWFEVVAAGAAGDFEAGGRPARGLRCKLRPWSLPFGPAFRCPNSLPANWSFACPKDKFVRNKLGRAKRARRVRTREGANQRNQRKGHPSGALFLRVTWSIHGPRLRQRSCANRLSCRFVSSWRGGDRRHGPCASVAVRDPSRTPSGLFRAKTAMLGRPITGGNLFTRFREHMKRRIVGRDKPVVTSVEGAQPFPAGHLGRRS